MIKNLLYAAALAITSGCASNPRITSIYSPKPDVHAIYSFDHKEQQDCFLDLYVEGIHKARVHDNNCDGVAHSIDIYGSDGKIKKKHWMWNWDLYAKGFDRLTQIDNLVKKGRKLIDGQKAKRTKKIIKGVEKELSDFLE